jgi:hypothetical protein
LTMKSESSMQRAIVEKEKWELKKMEIPII